MKVPSPSLIPGCTLWLTIVGALCGIVSAFYLNMADPVEYESTAIVRSIRQPVGASGASHREWLNTEAAAMESQENLGRVAKNLNFESEQKKSRDECVRTLKGMVKVEAVPDSALIRVAVRSTKSAESAEIANAVVTARTEFHREKFDHAQIDKYLNKNGERSDSAKHRALLNALAEAKLLPERTTDAGLMNLTLPDPLKKLRDDWTAEKSRLEEMRKRDRENPPSFVEILETAVPSNQPVDTGGRLRMMVWGAGGAGAGFLLSLALAFFFKRTTDSPGPAKSFFRRYAPGMAFAGILAGTIAGILRTNLEEPVFEGAAVFQPARMAPLPAGVTHREWLNTEAATLASQKNLERVARNLNLPSEWQCSMEECVAKLKNRLEIAGIPATELIRVVARAPSAGESASIANAIIDAREEQTDKQIRPEVMARISELSTNVSTLQKSAWQKKSELVAAIQALNITVNTNSDDAIDVLTLPQLLADARTEWHAERMRVETAKADLAASGASETRYRPYAEILESAVPPVNPVPREWIPRSVTWSAAGAVAALMLCLLLAIENRRATPPENGKSSAGPQPLLAGDY